jgi:hypothetical protein
VRYTSTHWKMCVLQHSLFLILHKEYWQILSKHISLLNYYKIMLRLGMDIFKDNIFLSWITGFLSKQLSDCCHLCNIYWKFSTCTLRQSFVSEFLVCFISWHVYTEWNRNQIEIESNTLQNVISSKHCLSDLTDPLLG